MNKTIKAMIRIPEGVRFADLKLARDLSGQIAFDWTPVEAICAASGLDSAVFRDSPEDNIAGLIIAWYVVARLAGEPPDAVQEDLIHESTLEDERGGGFSHPPGHA